MAVGEFDLLGGLHAKYHRDPPRFEEKRSKTKTKSNMATPQPNDA